MTPHFTPDLDAVRRAFTANFTASDELGAGVSVWRDGVEILSLAGGHRDRVGSLPWKETTLAPVFSATKVPTAVCTLLALDAANLPIEAPVAEVWPEFAAAGKAGVTFAHVLTHTAGLSALDNPPAIDDYQAVILALEQQAPQWPVGSAQGYHARTFGFLLDEIVRRLTGAASLGEFFHTTLARPLGLDFWIGLPNPETTRVAEVLPGRLRADPATQIFVKAWSDPASLTRRTFTSPRGYNSPAEYNLPAFRAAGFAGLGGVASARGLAGFHSLLASGGMHQGTRFIPERVLRLLETPLSQAEDLVLLTPVAFAAGVMKDPVDADGRKLRRHFGPSLRAFGHPGAGGCLGFADPENGLAFAYVMNRLEPGALPGSKPQALIDALYAGLNV
jgi:CubicO group peptidase (beta-lactamase class C family)